MPETVIKVENLGKEYRLGLVGSKTLSSDISRLWARIRGKEDPSLQVGVENKMDAADGEYIWALKDINFELKRGEVLGVIGKNGAGKSTLLKILSKVTAPTTGTVKIEGRIASLLEVGTGFHPELTGMENIYLNGAILGMTKSEIRSKFDEIVEFSGIEKYINTPVKRYSSGMYVRLAFAVAAHLDPEILIVDEVLAVGDAEFQKKAMGKMRDISGGSGRTVIFVSHNLGSINQLCRETMILKNGNLDYRGPSSHAIDRYLSFNTSGAVKIRKDSSPVNENRFKTFINVDANNNERDDFKYDDPFGLFIEINLPQWDPNLELAVSLQDKYKKRIFTIHEPLVKYYKGEKALKLQIVIPSLFITPGLYSWMACINHPGYRNYDLQEDIAAFSISETGSEFSRYDGADYGVVFANYQIHKIS